MNKDWGRDLTLGTLRSDRRRRQRERLKRNTFMLGKKTLHVLISIVHLFAVSARLRRENSQFHVL